MAGPAQNIRELSDSEIATRVGELREQLFKLRWQAASGQVENPNKIRAVRRDIARHLTVQGERARAAAAEAQR